MQAGFNWAILLFLMTLTEVIQLGTSLVELFPIHLTTQGMWVQSLV